MEPRRGLEPQRPAFGGPAPFLRPRYGSGTWCGTRTHMLCCVKAALEPLSYPGMDVIPPEGLEPPSANLEGKPPLLRRGCYFRGAATPCVCPGMVLYLGIGTDGVDVVPDGLPMPMEIPSTPRLATAALPAGTEAFDRKCVPLRGMSSPTRMQYLVVRAVGVEPTVAVSRVGLKARYLRPLGHTPLKGRFPEALVAERIARSFQVVGKGGRTRTD